APDREDLATGREPQSREPRPPVAERERDVRLQRERQRQRHPWLQPGSRQSAADRPPKHSRRDVRPVHVLIVTRPTVLALVSSITLAAGCQHRIEGIDGRRALQRVVHQVEAGPRIPGTPGYDAIRAWIVSELERLGAKVEVQETVDTLDGRRLDL